MSIRLSDLPPDLQRRILGEKRFKTASSGSPKAKGSRSRSSLMKVCACGSEIFRPDGHYPAVCVGCGAAPAATAIDG